MTPPALTLRQHGVLALVVAAMLEDRGPILPNACRLAAACSDAGPRLVGHEIEHLIGLGVLVRDAAGRIAEPDVLAAIERSERNRRALAVNAKVGGLSKAEKDRRNNPAALPSGTPNHPFANADALLRRVALAIGVDMHDPEAVSAWSSVGAMQLVRAWRKMGLSDEQVEAEARDWAAHAVDRAGSLRAIAFPSRLHDWISRAARATAPAGV